MAKRNNPASRLLPVLRSVQNARGNTVLEGWIEIFRVPDGELHLRAREVARMLSLMQDQLAEVRAQLAATDYDPQIYSSTLNHIQGALAITGLSGAWGSVRDALTQEVLGLFAFIAEVLPEDEPRIDDAGLAELADAIAALVERISSGDLPPTVKFFLLRQLDIVRTTLRDYPVRGSAAFREASLVAVAEWNNSPPEMARYADREEVRATKQLWPKLVSIGKGLAVVHMIVAGLLGTTKLALDVVQDVKLLGPGSSVEHPKQPDAPTEPNIEKPKTRRGSSGG